MPCSAATDLRPITTGGSCWRRFMFGKRSVPPATTTASGPCSASICVASSSDLGARYSKWGRRSTQDAPLEDDSVEGRLAVTSGVVSGVSSGGASPFESADCDTQGGGTLISRGNG